MLTRPIRLLKCAAKAGLECAAEKAAQLVGLDFCFAWGKRTWEFYSRESQGVRLAEVAELAAATPEEIHDEVVKVVAEAATGESEDVRQRVVQLLTQVPATIRQTLRRPADPSGTTLPPGMRLDSADDLAKLLPQRLPRFKPGDRPAGMPWQLEEKLGDGGFGEVWKARHAKFPGIAPVALKFCLDAASASALRGESDTGAVGVLEHEARVLERVLRHGKHPGIVELRNAYLEADPPCLEYEFVEGGELTKLIEEWRAPNGGVPYRSAADVVQRLAEIVGFAHTLPEPIVHRDLKPSNVLVRRLPNGRYDLKIADFGIGGLAASAANRQASARPASAVETGLSLMRGAHTPIYSSPQQKRGHRADPRDDVHALGVIWYQMLIGDAAAERPAGRGWQRRLEAQRMPQAWIDLLVSCIEEDPGDRPANAALLAERLATLLGEHQAVESPTAPVDQPETATPSVRRDNRTEATRQSGQVETGTTNSGEPCPVRRERVVCESESMEPVMLKPPETLAAFVGQEPIIRAVKTLVDLAKQQGNPFPHVLLCGQRDMGKATLVRTIPRELGVELQSTSAKRLRNDRDLLPYLTNAAEGSVLLIEDVEVLKNTPREMLVEAITHFRIDFAIGKGIGARTINMPLKRFTIAMTTTKASQVDDRLCRHALVYHLAPYNTREIGRIIDRLAIQLELRIDPDAIDLLAAHCKGSPGSASTMAMRLQTFFGGVQGGCITADVAKKALSVFGLAHDDVLVTGHAADVLRMSGVEFEQFVADLFRRLGYAVEITGASGDHGIDLLMRKDSKLVVAQCKRWENPVGEPVLRDFFGSMVSTGANSGYVITTSSFTAQAATFAENKPIRLIDLDKLNQLVVESNAALPQTTG